MSKRGGYPAKGTILQVFLYVAVASIAMAIGQLVPNLGLLGAFGTIAGAVVLLVGMIVGISFAKERQVQDLLERLVADLRSEIVGLLETYRLQLAGGLSNEVMNTRALIAFEESCSASHIIIVTTNMEQDRPGEPIFDVVLRNVKNGVRYTYVSVRSPETRAKVADIRKFLGEYSSLVSFVLVPRLQMEVITETDLAVYEFDDTESIVIVAVPVRDKPDQFIWLKLHKDFAYRIAGRVRALEDSPKTEVIR